MANGKHSGLLGPGGQPLKKDKEEPRIIVLKHPMNVGINPRLATQISESTRCSVIILPMDSELMMGELAKKEIESMHKGIHAILQIPEEKQ